jgi:DNA-directed RNA polymerase
MTGLNTIEEAHAHPLWNDQEALEQEMRSLGVENYRKNAEKALDKGQETRIAPVRRMMQDAHHKMVDALNGFYADVEAKKAGSKFTSYKYLKPMDIDVVAHLTCRVVLDMGSQKKTLTHLSVILGEALEDECNYRHFQKEHVAGYRAAAKRVAKSRHQGHIRRSVKASAGLLGVDMLEWPKKDMVNVGAKLIELFVESTGLVTLNKTQDKLTVETTPEAKAWMEKEGRHCELLAPTYLPTLIPPRPWTSPFDGGYWTNRAKRLTLVKKPGGGRAYLTELAEYEMPEVYQGINALQNTSWHVNARVYEVMSTMWDEGNQSGVIPLVDPQPLPTKPVWLVEGLKKEDMDEEQQLLFRKWKAECSAIHEANAEMEGRRSSFLRTLWVAEKFKNRDEFFFPHALDWRGRAYPVPLYLHPQGSDAQRGLLEFSEMCPINDQEAADWLMIHGAGLFGEDKCAFEDRIEWVKAHEAEILASAADPYQHTFWQTAEKGDKAWQALAFCFDYAGFVKEGFGYLSSLPVQMDGTCNGIQNFSAMLLDERGGAAVNLVPAAKPQDIYMEVGKVVIARVNQEAAEGNEFAAMWVGNVDRKVVKRPVMTLAYGAKRYGFTEMVMQDTVNVLVKKHPEMFEGGRQGFGAAQYMAGLIWDAVQEVVVAAANAMKWLQEVASIVTKEALPINWITPTGLWVQQIYKLRNMKELKIAFQSVRIAPRIDFGGDKLDSKKQSSGIAPNWVHSLDASHMTKTICASTYAGMKSFSFIHDSYGTHAGNTAALANILREQFVGMYSEGCVLQRFKEDLETMMGGAVTLPAVPAKGNLDLSKVLESKFFFA